MVQGLANFEIEDGPPSVYLDNNASTPLLAPVRDAMVDALDRLYGNPSGQHRLAQAARQAVEQAKQATARYLNASASEISFTCSASASIEQAVGNALRAGVRKLVIGATDHAAVVRASEECSRFGAEKVVIPVDRSGQLSVEALAAQISDAQTYVCTGAVNNETGGITDLQTLGAICRRAGAGLHVDASQAVGRIALDVARIDCDSMTLSPHKFHGPKGVGVLYARSRPGTDLPRSEKGGTPNVCGIVGTGAALEAVGDWESQSPRIASLRDTLEAAVLAGVPDAQVNAAEAPRVANTSSIYFPFRNAADLVHSLSRRGVFASAGAACSSGNGPSHVIRAMGFNDQRANGSVRFSLSRLTTSAEIELAIPRILDAYHKTLHSEAVS
jgi:cysteine desulfurase